MRQEFRFSGVGGQGIITLGYVIGRAAALYDNKQVIMTEAYGPEQTGGFARTDLVISDEEIDYPMINYPDTIVIMDTLGFERDAHRVKKDGQLIVDTDLVRYTREVHTKLAKVPAFKTASDLGKKVVANVVMMGVFQEMTGAISKEALKKALLERVPKGTEELNLKALAAGYEIGKTISNEVMN